MVSAITKAVESTIGLIVQSIAEKEVLTTVNNAIESTKNTVQDNSSKITTLENKITATGENSDKLETLQGKQ